MGSFRFHREDAPHGALAQSPPLRAGLTVPTESGITEPVGDEDQTIARDFLNGLFASDSGGTDVDLKASPGTGARPVLEFTRKEQLDVTSTRLVFFEQQHEKIKVFGSHAVVELNQNADVVSASAEVTGVGNLVTRPALGPLDARAALASTLGVPDAQVPDRPALLFFDAGPLEGLRLVWFFEDVAVAPQNTRSELDSAACDGHGLGPSPRQHSFAFDYLVDAEDGRLRYYYSRTPLADGSDKAADAIPVECDGYDDEGRPQKLYARGVGTGFELDDPLGRLRTFDLGGADFTSTLLSAPARYETAALPPSAAAAVSAHVNAGVVCDFYRSVLKRDGIDGRGMVVESVVNCSYQKPGEWRNAVWHKNRMWYGRASKAGGNGASYLSYARYLDVVAHELTHGVTDHTSKLVYRDQSGALNESFSDIFGILIKNFALVSPDSVVGWSWEIGPGLGKNGRALRDISDPAPLGYPTSAAFYAPLDHDQGGVHYWSSVPNLAAYHVLTARTDAGAYAFTPKEVAVLYYLTLTRLDPLATFQRCLSTLLDVAKTYYGDPTRRAQKIPVILDAYARVGITVGS